MNPLLFPEELLERILEEVVLYPSPSYHCQASPEAPSTTLGPSPISTPSSTPKNTPSATRQVSPYTSPTRSRPSTPVFAGSSSSSHPTAKCMSEPSTCNGISSTSISAITHGKANAKAHMEDVRATASCSDSSSSSNSSTPRPSPSLGTTVVTPLDLALAPLLTCRLFARIALPLYYRVVRLKTRNQARLFLENGLGCEVAQESQSTRRASPGRRVGCDGRWFRAKWVRRLVIGGIWKEAGEVIKVLAALIPPSQSSSSAQLESVVKVKGKGKAKAEVGGEDGVHTMETAIPISLKVFEITIDASLHSPQSTLPASGGLSQDCRTSIPAQQDEDAEVFANALRVFAGCWNAGDADALEVGDAQECRRHQKNPVRHIVLRKPQNVYLTQPRSRSVISALASLVESAEGLESAFVAFRISDDPQIPHVVGTGAAGVYHHAFQVQHPNQNQRRSTTSPQAPGLLHVPGPITQLTSALASRPKLKTFVTMLPSVWNEAVLRVSRNEALERIVLLGLNGVPVVPPFVSPSQFSPSYCTGSHSDSPMTNTGPMALGSAGTVTRPRLAVALPLNPVERVYAASTRDVNGFHPTNPNAHTSAVEPHHHPTRYHGTGYGGGGHVSMGTGLFMNQAKKHERLCELIGCGAEPPGRWLRNNEVDVPVSRWTGERTRPQSGNVSTVMDPTHGAFVSGRDYGMANSSKGLVGWSSARA